MRTKIIQKLKRSVGLIRRVQEYSRLKKMDANFYADEYRQVFFGYYDVSPFSADGKTLLACRAEKPNVSPHKDHPELEIGYFTLAGTGGFVRLAQTHAWNWQQGCRLQHVGPTANLAFNDFDGERYVCRIMSQGGEILQTLSCPVYKISPDGETALSLNFSRLHRLRRGYGYSQLADKTAQENASQDDGLWQVDIASGGEKLLFSLAQLAEIEPLPSMADAVHYLNHLDYSPQGQRICFMHLWLDPAGKRHNRIIVCDRDGGRMLIPTNEGHASHHCWKSENELMIYCRRKDSGEAYHLFDLETGSVSVPDPLPREDGHPNFISPGDVLTDTYPDKERYQTLAQFDLSGGRKTVLGRFFMPPQFTKELRCDLHPRLNVDHSQVCVDMVRKGRRALCVMPLAQPAA